MAPTKLLITASIFGLAAFTSAQSAALYADPDCKAVIQSVGCDDVKDSCTKAALPVASYMIHEDPSDCPDDGGNNSFYGFAFFKTENPDERARPNLFGGGGISGCKNFGCQRMECPPD